MRVDAFTDEYKQTCTVCSTPPIFIGLVTSLMNIWGWSNLNRTAHIFTGSRSKPMNII
jgi:hypothetical protein